MNRFIKPLTLLAAVALLQGMAPAFADSDGDAQASRILSNGLGLIRENRNQEAAVELRKAVALVPDSAKAHHSLGLALAKIGDNDGAIKSFIKAIELNPNLDSAWLTLGGFYQSRGKLDDALLTYEAFLQRFKSKPESADSCKKVAALREGLEKERDRLKRTRDETSALQAGYPQLKNALLNAPAQSALDDYVPEATRQGHIHRWSKLPIKVYVHDAMGVPGYKPAWGAILQQSFRDWERASDGVIRFEFVDEPPQDGIDIMWVAVAGANAGLQQEAEAGEAVMYTLNDDLHHGTIKILTKSFSSVLPLTDNRIRFICLHEIGHALGLSGHTDNPEDVMFLSTSFKDEWRDLTGRDARTIQRLYTGK